MKIKNIKINETALGISAVLIFAAGITLSMTFNLWKTSGSRMPGQFSSGPLAGLSNPEEIRGMNTLSEISSVFGIPLEVLSLAFEVDISIAAGFRSRDLEDIHEEEAEKAGKDVGNDAMKLFVSLYLDIPFTPKEDTALPRSAVKILLEKYPGKETYLNQVSLP